ncbi:MAG: hypothetical protein HY391_05245 [Deltaproteobacteria bacterium]|nr:hypothetical protein [Deltaproteobacteria bacterium]
MMTLLLYDRKRMARKIKILLPAFALLLCSQARGEESYQNPPSTFSAITADPPATRRVEASGADVLSPARAETERRLMAQSEAEHDVTSRSVRGDGGSRSYTDSVTAFFERRVITSLELRTEAAIDRALFQGRAIDSAHLTRAELLNYLPRLVREILIDREALRFLEYETFGADVAGSIRRVSSRLGAAEWSRFLTVSGLRESELREMVARKLRVSAFEKKKLTSIPALSPELPFPPAEKKLVDQKRRELYERWIGRLIKNAQVTYLTDHLH